MRQRSIVDDFLDALKEATVEFVSARIIEVPLPRQQQPRTCRVSGKVPKAKKAKTEKPAKRERAEPTLYQVLGVDAKAEPEVIEAAWKAKARLYHPDLYGDRSAVKMKIVNHAHDVLRDPIKRREYDKSIREAK